MIWLLIGPAFLWVLLAIKPDSRKHPMVFATTLPIAAWILVTWAILLIAYGSTTAEDQSTQSFVFLEVSSVRLRDAATIVGAGIITGLVAGAVIALANRWHDHERDQA